MPVKPKTRLTIDHPAQLLLELLQARKALKRTRGGSGVTTCPNLDTLCVALQSAAAAQDAILAASPTA